MAQTISKLMSNAMLVFSSAVCIKFTPRSFKYARFAFKLYLVAGAIGALNALFASTVLEDCDQILWAWCYCLGIPLLAADLCVLPQVLPDVAPFHLAVPLYSVFSYHIHPELVDHYLLSISHSMSIVFLSFWSAWEGHISGYALAFLHFFIMWRIDGDEKSHVDWAMQMAVSNFLALHFIEWLMEEK